MPPFYPNAKEPKPGDQGKPLAKPLCVQVALVGLEDVANAGSLSL